MNMRNGRLAASCVLAVGLYAAPQAVAQTAGGLTIEVLSSRPQMVTGGDALVRIAGTDAAPSVTAAGADASSAFKSDGKGGWIGLVGGLKDGDNQIVAKAAGKEATLTVNNHPINGTLFAGPQQKPFVCENENFKLAPAKDDSCAAPSRVDYYYRNKGGEWKAFDPAGPRPADIGTTKTIAGKEVPLIVRQEKGVINRSAYAINILHDPAAGPLPTPTAASAASGWNGKLVYSFGGGVQANYHMGRGFGMTGTDNKFFLEDLGAGMVDYFVTRGYAVAQGSLNVMGTNNDDVKSGETASKIKEHFIKEFGAPLFTIGHGASGGSMQQHLIGNNYPGILDGIMPARSYPDVMTFLQPLYDCEMIGNVVDKSANKWTYEQKGAVSGKYWGYCVSNGTRYPNARPEFCDATVTDVATNDPEWKQKGVRCTFQDNLVNIYGRDPKTGFARNPFDNVGVQYGLNALKDGKISAEQFLELNSKIGGMDANGKIVAQRMVADPVALKAAYETGRVNTGAGGLASIPIVDIRSYVDGDPVAVGDANVDVHDGYHSETMRQRLLKYNGNADNHVMFTVASLGRVQFDTRVIDATVTRQTGTPLSRVSGEGLQIIDDWLTAIANDKSDLPKAKKVAANRPKGLVDTCFPATRGGIIGYVDRVTDAAECKKLFPFSGDARLAAGAPRTDDVFKCQLKPVDAADYAGKLNADQVNQVKAIFPNGVCDYSKAGVEQTAAIGTWVTFKAEGDYAALDARR